jgi:protein O-mannosyl-transferase
MVTTGWIVGGRARATIALLALGASLSGLGNGFAYDDRPVILKNGRLHHILHIGRLWSQTYWPPSMGAALYRPLTMTAFSIEWWAGHGAPWVFHAVNILLYVLTCLLVFWLATLVLTRTAAWLAAALFAVHPVHVEAVANAVGQSELWAACGVVAAVAAYIRFRRAAIEQMITRPSDDPAWTTSAVGGALPAAAVIMLIIAACLAKEHAVVAPALLLAAEVLLIQDPRPWARRARSLRPCILALFAAVLCYVVVRTQVVGALTGDRVNVILEHLSPAGRRWTMLGVAGDWARLLIWPSRLAVEYSPREITLYDHFTAGLVPISILLLFLGGLVTVSVKRWPAAAFALIWTAVTLALVSNLVVPTGVLLAERTLFLPSVGIVLLAGALFDRVADELRKTAPRAGSLPSARRLLPVAVSLTVIAVLGAGTWQSARRQLVWRSNSTVFAQAVVDAPLSYRAHDVYAGELFEHGDRAGGEREARIALALYPHDAVLYRDLANEYMVAGLCQAAVPLFRRSIAEATFQMDSRLLLAECLLAQGEPDSARAEVLRGTAEGFYGPAYHKVLLSVDSAFERKRHGGDPRPGVRSVSNTPPLTAMLTDGRSPEAGGRAP